MKRRYFPAILIGLASATACLPAYSGETQVSGFLRAAGAITTGDTPYLERIDKNGNTGDSHFGLNISRQVNDNLKVAGQLYAGGAEGGEYTMALDWAFATLNLSEGLDVMLGKIKFPNLMVSDYVDVGIAYPWVRAPQEVYSFEAAGNPNMSLESFVGGSIMYQSYMGDFDYSAQLYAGEHNVETGGTLSKMVGAKLVLSNDMFALHGGYNQHMPEGTKAENGTLAEKNGKTVSSYSLGVKANYQNAVVYSEYVKGSVEGMSSLDTTGMYVTLGYRLGSVLPHFTYATLDAEEGQSSMTGGIKYQMDTSSTLKLDITQVTPDEEDSFNVISVAYDVVF